MKRRATEHRAFTNDVISSMKETCPLNYFWFKFKRAFALNFGQERISCGVESIDAIV